MGRSRSRSRGRRSRSRSQGRSDSPDGHRVHVADLGLDPSKREIEKCFEKYGTIFEIWVARNPPCFAFIVYKRKEAAEQAIQDMDGQVFAGGRVRVTHARPRNRGGRKRGVDPDLRCFSCGERGHFSRECDAMSRRHFEAGYKRRSRSRSRSRSREPQRRSRSHDRRDRRRTRDSRSRSRSQPRSQRRSHSHRSTSKSPKRRRESKESRSPKKESRNGERSRSRSFSRERERVAA